MPPTTRNKSGKQKLPPESPSNSYAALDIDQDNQDDSTNPIMTTLKPSLLKSSNDSSQDEVLADIKNTLLLLIQSSNQMQKSVAESNEKADQNEKDIVYLSKVLHNNTITPSTPTSNGQATKPSYKSVLQQAPSVSL